MSTSLHDGMVTGGTLVFLDLETTGLPEEIGSVNVQITELALVAVDVREFKSFQGEPRAINKLCLCFQPRVPISFQAALLTGLDNLLLEHHTQFSKNSTELLCSFLRHLQSPIWLVAHNGLRFDFPLLKAELNHAYQNATNLPEIFCIDTMAALKDIIENPPQEPTFGPSKLSKEELVSLKEEMRIIQDNYQEIDEATTFKYDEILNTPPSKRSIMTVEGDTVRNNLQSTSSIVDPPNYDRTKVKRNLFETEPSTSQMERRPGYKLEALYQHFFKGREFDSHCAEEDCRALMLICHQVKDNFLKWILQNKGQTFNSIEPLW
ncbi:TREX2 [Cordylochernes scorpioides]|uniref:TREX2 n=1 Tax=Cordylochernes scorpioides TaxID=51811 RepID=A0ABY6LP44_9ARAC|nr:TREX2 [Cordylochernes scorpioides]